MQRSCLRARCLQEIYSIGGYTNGELRNKEGVEIKEKEGVVYIDDYQPAKPTAGHGEAGENDELYVRPDTLHL